MKNLPLEVCQVMTYNQLDTTSFVAKARSVHGHFYDYSKTIYTKSANKVTIICPTHGEFEQNANSHLIGSGCKKCYHLKAGSYKRLTVTNFIEKAKFIHGETYDYSKVIYKNNSTKIKILCLIHGEFEQLPNDHLSGKGCTKCKAFNLSLKFRSSVEEFIEKSMLIHKGKYNYKYVDYVNSKTKVDIICFKHGTFKQTPSKHLSGHGCPTCKASVGELTLYKILKDENINFIQEFRLDTHYKFLYDFYLPDHNLLIEFHGIQHYMPVDFFGGIEGYNEIVFRDSCKRDLAKMHKLPIIEFNYRQLNELSTEQFRDLVLMKLSERKNQ